MSATAHLRTRTPARSPTNTRDRPDAPRQVLTPGGARTGPSSMPSRPSAAVQKAGGHHDLLAGGHEWLATGGQTWRTICRGDGCRWEERRLCGALSGGATRVHGRAFPDTTGLGGGGVLDRQFPTPSRPSRCAFEDAEVGHRVLLVELLRRRRRVRARLERRGWRRDAGRRSDRRVRRRPPQAGRSQNRPPRVSRLTPRNHRVVSPATVGCRATGLERHGRFEPRAR